ncbi:MAG: Sir2 family NAD-dependent protein deacetylase [Capsulimonadaceae bacterium]|nr:Sir2 family NAD-dependent protein deacetylase [Capsulimonadaceae bacterium]
MKILVFTGAGISRESGLKTFRDSDGLWEGHRIEDVCTVEAWATQPAKVLDFYNARRREVRNAQPNEAHHAIARLEGAGLDVVVVTQNVDDLHERAGSSRVVHLHGEITKMRPDDINDLVECPGDIKIGDVDERGRQYRPHVVFFGEGVWNMHVAMRAQTEADVLLVAGSTLAVYPAASVADECPASNVWIVDPQFPDNARLLRRWARGDVEFIPKRATEGVPEAVRAIVALAAEDQ